MPALSLRQAAQETGTSRSTIFRAIRAGRITATRSDDGGYFIEPVELFRVYPRIDPSQPRPRTDKPEPIADDAIALKAHAAQLEHELAMTRQKLEAMEERAEAAKLRADELREEKDHWRTQAERLSLTGPLTSTTPSSGLAAFVRSLLPHRSG
jgi:excisionase family DNA binding protein